MVAHSAILQGLELIQIVSFADAKRANILYGDPIYLNVVNLTRKLRNTGYDILDPIAWYIDQRC